jgi:hypothetical protein
VADNQVVLWNIIPGKLGSLPNASFQTRSKNAAASKFSTFGDLFAVTLNDYSRVKAGSGKSARHILPVYIYRVQQGTPSPFMSLITPDSNGMAKIDHISWTIVRNKSRIVAGCSNQFIYFWLI